MRGKNRPALRRDSECRQDQPNEQKQNNDGGKDQKVLKYNRGDANAHVFHSCPFALGLRFSLRWSIDLAFSGSSIETSFNHVSSPRCAERSPHPNRSSHCEQ